MHGHALYSALHFLDVFIDITHDTSARFDKSSKKVTVTSAQVKNNKIVVYVIVNNQVPRFVCNIEAQVPRAKPKGGSASILHTKGGIDYFLAHCFYQHSKHIFSPQELYECLPSPSRTVY